MCWGHTPSWDIVRIEFRIEDRRVEREGQREHFNWCFQVGKQMMNTPGTAETISKVQALVLFLLKERGVWAAAEQSRTPGPGSVRPRGLRKGRNVRDVLKTGSTGLNDVRDN